MPGRYDSSSIEVLKGLEPVRKRPGMYTQTERPNHLAQEVVDNSVDEAITGYARQIDVILHKDGSLTVVDDGRGMPVDRHKGEKVSGVEVILTRSTRWRQVFYQELSVLRRFTRRWGVGSQRAFKPTRGECEAQR